MIGKHTKHNHCEHKNLEYCMHCKVVHCLDCKQEFPEKEIVYVEKQTYRDRGWGYPFISYEDSGSQPIRAVSDKTVYDKDRFDQKIMGDLVECIHRSSR